MTPTTTDVSNLKRKKKIVEVEVDKTIPPMPPCLQEALYQTFHNSKVPAKVIAQRIGVSYQLLANGLNLNSDFKFSAKHFLPLMKISDNYVALRYLSEQTGHIMYRLPEAKKLDRGQMMGIALAGHGLIGKMLARMDSYFNERGAVREEAARKLFLELSVLVEVISVLKASIEFVGWEEKSERGSENVK